jgi:hypothetical protein
MLKSVALDRPSKFHSVCCRTFICDETDMTFADAAFFFSKAIILSLNFAVSGHLLIR